jgi:hypothetical protein
MRYRGLDRNSRSGALQDVAACVFRSGQGRSAQVARPRMEESHWRVTRTEASHFGRRTRMEESHGGRRTPDGGESRRETDPG